MGDGNALQRGTEAANVLLTRHAHVRVEHARRHRRHEEGHHCMSLLAVPRSVQQF